MNRRGFACHPIRRFLVDIIGLLLGNFDNICEEFHTLHKIIKNNSIGFNQMVSLDVINLFIKAPVSDLLSVIHERTGNTHLSKRRHKYTNGKVDENVDIL